MAIDILSTLDGKWEDGTRPADIFAEHIAPAPELYVDTIIDGLGDERRKVQSGCAELAALLSEREPEMLMPHADLFESNLDADAPVLRWEAVCVLGNLAAVDAEQRFAQHIPTIEENLTHESIVLQGHSVRALSKMAVAYPDHADGILEALLSVQEHFPKTTIGFLVEAMGYFGADPALRETARAFAEEHLGHSSNAVRTKAKRAIKALDAS